MDTHTTPTYLRANFAPADRLAVVVLNRTTADTKQRLATTERIAQDAFQRWLRFLNKDHYEIYVSMNTIREDANGRKKSDIAQIRHVYLDFDVNGTEAVRQMLGRGEMPSPNHLIESSPSKWQAIWRVEGFEATQAENLMRGMVREFGADPAAVDSARVLRLPGFYNYKYETPHFVRVQNLSADVYTPSQFPGFGIPEPAAHVASIQHQPSPAHKRKLQAGISQSELDWAYAKRALTRGEDPETIIQKMAAVRSDKPDPEYYARYTVTKAAAGLDAQQKPKPEMSLGFSPSL